MKVTTGELISFDSSRQPISIEHIMASGALPPDFPPMRIDGDLYWDGGLSSNTPLEPVLEDHPAVDTLCFMVDLWSAAGPEPTTLDQVQARQKDIMYASRSKRQIEDYLKTHVLQHTVRSLYPKVPVYLRSEVESQVVNGLGRNSVIQVVRLQYGGRDWNMSSKDINFSKGSIDWRWDQGYQDAIQAVKHADWEAAADEDVGLVLHELPHKELQKKWHFFEWERLYKLPHCESIPRPLHREPAEVVVHTGPGPVVVEPGITIHGTVRIPQ